MKRVVAGKKRAPDFNLMGGLAGSFLKKVTHFIFIQIKNINLIPIFRGKIAVGGMVGKILNRHEERSLFFSVVPLIHNRADNDIIIGMIDAADNMFTCQVDADNFRVFHFQPHEFLE